MCFKAGTISRFDQLDAELDPRLLAGQRSHHVSLLDRAKAVGQLGDGHDLITDTHFEHSSWRYALATDIESVAGRQCLTVLWITDVSWTGVEAL